MPRTPCQGAPANKQIEGPPPPRQLLVSFYSDVNYVREGFFAEFETVGETECSTYCIESGLCDDVPSCDHATGSLDMRTETDAHETVMDAWVRIPHSAQSPFTPRQGHSTTYIEVPPPPPLTRTTYTHTTHQPSHRHRTYSALRFSLGSLSVLSPVCQTR